MTAGIGRVDIDALRAAHPIEQVVAASGVQLTPRGRGFMGCCPFHDDSTASMSVGGAPGRYTCFGCGAAGDVVDFVQRLHGLSFLDAVQALEQGSIPTLVVPGARALRVVPAEAEMAGAEVPPNRAYEINALAWGHYSTPVATGFASSYLRHHRGLDLTALQAEHAKQPLVGHAGTGWTTLTDRLRGDGVTDAELLGMDLAQVTRTGRLIDTLRDRLILPVTDSAGRIEGFIGRHLGTDPRAPKYRNPTRTPTFDKASAVYRPTHHELYPDATVVVVEGVLDALAIAAAAAHQGRSGRFAPCTTSGVTVSPTQADQVLAMHPRPPVIALDGDTAGADGTTRWLTALSLKRDRPALVTRLPDGADPADWLARHGGAALGAFDRRNALPPGHGEDGSLVRPYLPGRELVRAALGTGRDPIRHTVAVLVPLALALHPRAAATLLHEAEREMTAQGWNPDDVFTTRLRREVLTAWQERHHACLAPSPSPAEMTIHRFPPGPSPGVA